MGVAVSINCNGISTWKTETDQGMVCDSAENCMNKSCSYNKKIKKERGGRRK